jgi:hypothetical protein
LRTLRLLLLLLLLLLLGVMKRLFMVQLVSGLNPYALWPSLLITDVIIFSVPAALILAFLAWANWSAFGLAHFPLMATFMLVYGLASISQVRRFLRINNLTTS